MARARARRVITRYVRRRRFSRPKATLPLALVAGFTPLGVDIVKTVTTPGMGAGQIPHTLAWHLGGYNTWDNSFSFSRLAQGWAPILIGFGVHKLANKLGVNRMIARAGVPWIRV